jgi:hypothetical protein
VLKSYPEYVLVLVRHTGLRRPGNISCVLEIAYIANPIAVAVSLVWVVIGRAVVKTIDEPVTIGVYNTATSQAEVAHPRTVGAARAIDETSIVFAQARVLARIRCNV